VEESLDAATHGQQFGLSGHRCSCLPRAAMCELRSVEIFFTEEQHSSRLLVACPKAKTKISRIFGNTLVPPAPRYPGRLPRDRPTLLIEQSS
jgi:hypothetical protein